MILKTPPGSEPVSLEEAKLHLRVAGDDEDPLINGLIVSAREYVEKTTRRALTTQTWVQNFDKFDAVLALKKPPLIQIESIKYIDPDGVEQTLPDSEYRTSLTETGHGVVRPAIGSEWPPTYWVEDAVTVEFQAGYGDATKIPAPIIHAVKLFIGHFYDERDGLDVPPAIGHLLSSYQVYA